MAKLGALLHRAADMTHPPGTKETKFLLPKAVLGYSHVKPGEWVQMVSSAWASGVQSMASIDSKANFLGKSLKTKNTHKK